MDVRVNADGYLNVYWVEEADLTDPAAPDVDELNLAALALGKAVAWDGTTYPGPTESNQIDDRSILDTGNATSRGFGQYEGTLNLFWPKDPTDTTSDFGKAFRTFFQDRKRGYLVTRVLQNVPNTPLSAADPDELFAVGDEIGVFRVMSDSIQDDTEGEDSYKYAINFLPQGQAFPITYVADSPAKGAITVTNLGSGDPAVGGYTPLQATLYGHRIRSLAEWTSSDNSLATVSKFGVVTRVAAGEVTITASHPSGTPGTIVLGA